MVDPEKVREVYAPQVVVHEVVLTVELLLALFERRVHVASLFFVQDLRAVDLISELNERIDQSRNRGFVERLDRPAEEHFRDFIEAVGADRT